jgi:hypothetical protein
MRLIKQSFLYFKEGNSDKVYEIDLCDVGNDKYVVNFRYGRKGSTLKEGSKTPVPVSLPEAEKIYNDVEEEKLNKGYTTSESGVSSLPQKAAFTITAETGFSTHWMSMPEGRGKAIVKRLYQSVQANAGTSRTSWKLSRVIWKAGEYKIKEAAPFIIQLFNRGDMLHQYCCTWALARSQDEASVEVLQAIYTNHASPAITRIAGAGLLSVLTGSPKEKHLTHYLNTLPEAMKAAIENKSPKELETLLQERINQQQPQYNWLENIYLFATEHKWIRPLVKQLLQQLPFKPGYFKHVRAIFKLAELLDDFEFMGLLATRIEREAEMFEYKIPSGETERETYIEAIEEYLNPHKELRKKNSRLAYSQKTKWYLHRRIRRRLNMLGDTNNNDYVKLATAVLIAYNRKADFKEAFSTHEYKTVNGRYGSVETRYPQNAQAVFMHQILSSLHPQLELMSGRIWRIKPEQGRRSAGSQGKSNAGSSAGNTNSGGIIQKLLSLFGKKKAVPVANATPSEPGTPAASVPTYNENGTPYLHLWNTLPQSYIQLLIDAELEEIHEFAVGGLTTHPDYAAIKEKLDKTIYKKLVLSAYTIPTEFGFTLAAEKYANLQPDADLVSALLNSNHPEARDKGKQWTNMYQQAYFRESDFIKDLVFARHAEISNWGKEVIRNSQPDSDLKKAVAGKAIAEMMSMTEADADNEAIITRASDTLLELFGAELQQVPLTIIADLLQHPLPQVLLFGLKLLKAKKQEINPDTLNKSLLFGLLQHPYAPVRDAGLSLLAEISDEVLLTWQDEIITSCLLPFRNTRQGLAPIITRMAQTAKAFGEKAATALMPYLLRKETSDGLHEDVSHLLCNELSNYLQNANKETALQLLYGNYTYAQNVGVVILEKYTQPDQLTIPQVIALGGHENLTVRAWCWKFYQEQTPRIRYEKEAAVKILESKWQDTRQFAMQYFREQFTADDWSPEVLITLADSVKPDVEAFGRELITKFFDSEQGEQYLLKLSQHPGEKMQLFATNYLERFAADDVAKIQSLEFYFRSVLTRVNKSRIAKNRIYQFLLTEGRKSEAAAKAVGSILSDVSATAAIGDKAKCIDVLLQLKSLYEVEAPLKVRPIETRA